MAFNVFGLIVHIIANVIFVAPVLWLSGRMLVGGERARFTDAIWIVTLGVVLGTVIGAFSSGSVGALISFITWLYLVKRFFECGWLKALAISIVAIIIYAIIIAALTLLGLSLFSII